MAKNMISLQAFDGALSTLESLVQAHKGKGRGYSITATFSVHARYSNSDEDPDSPDSSEEARVVFQMRYQIKAHSSYILVDWNPQVIFKKGVREDYTPNWQVLADHDSCWRDADGPVKDWIRSETTSSTKWDNAYPFIYCDEIKIEDLG